MTCHRLLLSLGMLALLLATRACQPATTIARRRSERRRLARMMTFPAGGEGGWDYPPSTRRPPPLPRRATRVMVLDTDKGTLLGEVADTPGSTASPSCPTFTWALHQRQGQLGQRL